MSLHQPTSALSEFDNSSIQDNGDYTSIGNLLSFSGKDSISDMDSGLQTEASLNLLSLASDTQMKQASWSTMDAAANGIGDFDFSDFDKGFENFKTDDQAKDAKKPLDLSEYKDNSFGAYSKALEEGKYTAILFETDLCVFCENLKKNLSDKSLGKYSDKMIASITNGDRDEGARQLEEALGVVRYPTLVVLKTNSENIHVAGRIEGQVSVSEIDRVFKKATEEDIRKKPSTEDTPMA